MKKLFSTLMMAMLLVMVSCSEADSPAIPDIRPSEELPVVDDAVPYDQTELATVFAALDSLNATMPSNVSRGFWGDLAVFMADQVGKAATRRFGKNVSRGCSALASAAVEMFIKDEVSETKYEMLYSTEIKPSEMKENDFAPTDPDLPIIGLLGSGTSRGQIVGDDDYNPVFSAEVDDDHIGYQHNYAMYEIQCNRQAYFINGKPKIDLLMNDIIYYVKCEDLDEGAQEVMSNVAQEIATVTVENYECGNNDEDLIWRYYYYLEESGLSDQELRIFMEFTAEIGFKCLNMTADEIHSYASSLHNLIQGLSISVDMKVELAIIAQCTLNSALFWQQ